MASAQRPSGGPPRDAPEPAGDGVVWHSTCGYADCVEPSRYAADSTCKGCRRIKYCTRECQKADWKRHKSACKAAEAADEAAAREGALVARPRARPPPPNPKLLFKAAQDGNLKHVEALLRLGADVNAADKDGFTPLYAASQEGHVAVVAALLTVPGVTVNAAVADGATPLNVASAFGHAAVVSALLALPGVAVNAAMTDGCTPLYIASQQGHTAVVSVLLAAPGIDVNAAMTNGWKPLMIASMAGHLAVGSVLLACMQYLNSLPTLVTIFYYYYGWTLGGDATRRGQVVLLMWRLVLLAAPGLSVNAAQEHGWTSLHWASFFGHAAVVSALLAHPNVREMDDDIAGSTPLRLARANGHLAVVTLLEARGGVM